MFYPLTLYQRHLAPLNKKKIRRSRRQNIYPSQLWVESLFLQLPIETEDVVDVHNSDSSNSSYESNGHSFWPIRFGWATTSCIRTTDEATTSIGFESWVFHFVLYLQNKELHFLKSLQIYHFNSLKTISNWYIIDSILNSWFERSKNVSCSADGWYVCPEIV